MTALTVDLGNSLCKLCAWRTPGPAARGDSPQLLASAEFGPHSAAFPIEIERWLAGLEAVERAAVCSTAGTGATADLAAALARGLGTRAELELDPASGLENRCRTPETVGADRLFAARGALVLVQRSCVVIDAGTAVTVDAVLLEASPGHAGAFLGGAIAPGPALLAWSLAEGTANLPRIEPELGVPALGRDTAGALRAGVGVGFQGAVRELARRIALEAGLERPALVVTGGARAHLLEPQLRGQDVRFDGFEGPPVESAQLVHRGLLAALE